MRRKGKEEMENWSERYEKEEKKGLGRQWERRIRRPLSQQKMSPCLCWGYVPHNTERRFTLEDAGSKWVNETPPSVANQSHV